MPSGTPSTAHCPKHPRSSIISPFDQGLRPFRFFHSCRKLIAAYAKWHAIHGKCKPTEWETVPGLPAPISACKRQMTKLRKDKPTLEAIAYAVVLVAQRRADAQGGEGQSAERTGLPPPEEGTPEAQQVARELSRMLEDERKKFRVTKDSKQKGMGSLKEYRALARVQPPPNEGATGGGAWDDETEPEFARALEEVARLFEIAKAAAQGHVAIGEAAETEDLGGNGSVAEPETKRNGMERNGTERDGMVEDEKGDDVGASAQPGGSDALAVQVVRERLEDNPDVATALGLIEIGLLHARPNGAISETVARALKRCGEADVATAMRHLQSHKFVVSRAQRLCGNVF
jgi:hypothetical protein